MTLLGRKPQVKQWAPVRKDKTADERKNEELYGRSAKIHGTSKKGDSALGA